MQDYDKTKEELINELAELRQRIAESEWATRSLGTKTDSADRKVAEMGRAVSEKRLADILRSNPAVIYTAKPAGDYAATFISDQITTQLGYEPKEFLEDSSFWESHIHPDDVQSVVDGMSQLFELDHHVLEYRFQHKDGIYRWMRDEIGLIRDENGTPVEIMGYWIDITDRKQAEEALQESEERLQLALRGADLGLWDWDLRTGKATRDERTAAIYGYPSAEIEPSFDMWESLIHPDDKPEVLERFNKCLEGSTPFYEAEYRLITKSGATKWVLAKGKVVERDRDGKPSRVSGTLLDISDRKRAEESLRKAHDELGLRVRERTAELKTVNESLLHEIDERKRSEQRLRESEENFRTFFESVDDMIIVGTPDGRVMYTNPAMSRKLGYSPDELKEMHVLDVHPKPLRKEAETIFAGMFRGEREVCPLPLETKSGELLPVETRVWFGKWSGVDCIFGICKDLSREQEALQRFDRLFRDNPALMAVSSLPERRFTDVNDSFLNTLGFAREEVIGRTSVELSLFVQPEIQQAAAADLEKKGSFSGIEIKVRRKDGTILEGLFSGGIVSTQGQEFFLSVLIDLTDQKRAEAAAREYEQRYRTLVENLNEGVFVVKGGVIQFINPRSVEFTGYSAEELTSGSFLQFIHPDDREMVMQRHMNRMAGDDTPYQYTMRIVTHDGILKWLLVQSRVIPWYGERATLVSATDITDRKKAEEALQEREAHLQSILNNAPFLMWLKDREGRFLAVNDVFAQSCGKGSPEAVVGKTDLDVWPLELAERYRADDSEVMNEKKQKHVEEPILDRGETKWFETFKTPILDANGNVMGTTGFARDITDLRRNRELLLQSERFRAVADLAGGVAHNFNNLLQVVIGYLEMALMDLEMGNYADIRDALENVLESSRFGAETVRRLQSFAGIRDRSRVPERGVFDLSGIVRQAVEMTRTWWKSIPEQQGRKVSLDIHLQDGCLVQGEKNDLFEVVVNLMKNATDALPQEGAIDVETRVEGDQVILKVRDTGIGISQENLKRLFNPFFTTKAEAGSGLGLASSRKIIEGCGGSIFAESSESKGTTFTIRLPLAEQPSERSEAPASPVLVPEKTVLVIDDMEGVLDVLKAGLTRSGYVVVTAPSGQQGLDIFKKNPIDLVICDLGMPGMSGWEVGKRIRSICEERGIAKTPFVLLTGWGGQQTEEERRAESGVDAVIEKPLNMKNTLEAVRAVVEKSRSKDSGE